MSSTTSIIFLFFLLINDLSCISTLRTNSSTINFVDNDHEIFIVDNDNDNTSITNRSNTFYSLDNDDDNNGNNLTILDNNDDDVVDDFWDSPSTYPSSSSSSSSTTSSSITTTTTTSSRSNSMSPSTTIRSTTPFLPPMPSILTWGTSPSSSSSSSSSSLSSSSSSSSSTTTTTGITSETTFLTSPSSIITTMMTMTSSTPLPPPFTNLHRLSPFTKKPFNSNKSNNNDNELSFDELVTKIWKLILHGTNMNSEELRMCNRTLIQHHFKKSSRRKVARNMKKDLEKIFNKWNYRFSIVVSTTSRNTMGKALHGVWMSISINGIHYFITATHNVLDGPKINEEQMEKIEYWAHVHAIAARNMTGYRRYNRIAQKLKFDLDRFYGNGNKWSVIIVKNPLLVKAKIFEDPDYHIEFQRLNGGHFIVFRGGQSIDLLDGRRMSRVDDNIDIDEPESDDHTLEMETEHEDYRNNIYLMMP